MVVKPASRVIFAFFALSTLPVNYLFTAADNGVHTFPITLRTAGNRSVTAADVANASLTGTATIVVNPAVASHGGRISLMDYQDGTVFVKMSGGCQGCGQASATLKQGVEKLLRERIPSITEVLDTTDHAGGRNPYYAP